MSLLWLSRPSANVQPSLRSAGAILCMRVVTARPSFGQSRGARQRSAWGVTCSSSSADVPSNPAAPTTSRTRPANESPDRPSAARSAARVRYRLRPSVPSAASTAAAMRAKSGLRLHPRTIPVQRAEADLRMDMFGFQEQHGLTAIEMLQCLTIVQQSILKMMLRVERHPDDPGRKADEE